jgi:hypothetical protein
MKITKLSKRTMQYTLNKLMRRSLIKRTQGGVRNGYIYDLLIPPCGPLHKRTGAGAAPVKTLTGANGSTQPVQIATSRSLGRDPFTFEDEDRATWERQRSENMEGVKMLLKHLDTLDTTRRNGSA